MNAFIFVSIMCIGQSCDFVTSNTALSDTKCKEMKAQFLALPFKKEVTLAAAQCLEFKSEQDNWKTKL